MSKKKIGFLGGTFDPPHFGHLNFAIEVLERGYVDQVLMCPAGQPPHKIAQKPFATAQQRLDMVSLACEEVKGIEVLDLEVKKNTPCYTIDAIRELKKKYEKDDTEIFLLLAEDAALTLASWKQPEELLSLTKLLVVPRNLLTISELSKNCEKEMYQKVQEAKKPIFEMGIASTIVRERLKKGLYCGHLVPHKVLEYIYKNKIYS